MTPEDVAKQAWLQEHQAALNPPQLTEQYFKTRKSLALFSGLLFAWEFIGIEIPSKPFENLNVKIKSPQAAPYVLLILVVYFTIRLLIEWYQSSYMRRELRTSKIDLSLSLAIPIVAIVTFTIQRILDIQVADKITHLGNYAYIIPILSGFLIGTSASPYILRFYGHPVTYSNLEWNIIIRNIIGISLLFLAYFLEYCTIQEILVRTLGSIVCVVLSMVLFFGFIKMASKVRCAIKNLKSL